MWSASAAHSISESEARPSGEKKVCVCMSVRNILRLYHAARLFASALGESRFSDVLKTGLIFPENVL